MNLSIRLIVLITFTIGCVVAVFFLPPIPQDSAYHNFADTRAMFGIPNFYNVISNLPFLILGMIGLYSFFKDETLSFSSLSVFTLFIGVMLVGLGSSYYHWSPSNTTLLWDRIPMTIIFMSFFACVVSTYVNKQWGDLALIPFLVIGIGSVLLWYFSEQRGHGDLRLYLLIQFYPMLAIPLILFMFPAARLVRLEVITVIVIYGIAKFFEHEDQTVFNALTFSGHSIKHVFAAASVFVILQMAQKKEM